MIWYHWVALFAFVQCLFVFVFIFIRLVAMGLPKDLSQASGSVKKGVFYSYVGAMSPFVKESAYLHLPTYAAGIVYHVGTFISLPLFIWLIISEYIGILTPSVLIFPIGIFLIITSLAGFSVLFKRIFKSELRTLSSPDDYISNLLTTFFQLLSGITLLNSSVSPVYFVISALFFLWLPIGKTKHVLYFFFARYNLGFFYGRRG